MHGKFSSSCLLFDPGTGGCTTTTTLSLQNWSLPTTGSHLAALVQHKHHWPFAFIINFTGHGHVVISAALVIKPL
jgi:hypothetical protein